MKKFLLLISAFCVVSPVLADEVAPAPAPAAPPAKEKRICRQDQVLGSNIPAHICLTKAEWTEFFKHYEETDQGFIERRKDRFNAIPMKSNQ